jgi:hypothetical protein
MVRKNSQFNIPARASNEDGRTSCFGDSDLDSHDDGGAAAEADGRETGLGVSDLDGAAAAADMRETTLGDSDLSKPGFADRLANGGNGGISALVMIEGRFVELREKNMKKYIIIVLFRFV